MVQTAAADANNRVIANYDFQNPQALKRLIAGGTQLRCSVEADHGRLPTRRPVSSTRKKSAQEPEVQEDLRGRGRTTSPSRTNGCRVEEQQFDNYMLREGRHQGLTGARREGKSPAARRGFFYEPRGLI